MVERISDFIIENEMILPGNHIVVGCSGGADSVALLLVLKQFQKQNYQVPFSFSCVHIHHGIRKEAAQLDAEYVQKLCETYRIPCEVIYVDAVGYAREKKISVEEAARILRYEQLQKVTSQRASGKIAVAHHKEDQAETIFHNLLRGSGLRGLSGMKMTRDNIIRPLLCITRNELEQYLLQQNVCWRDDETNQQNDYTRNRIRNRIFPLLREEVNEHVTDHLLQIGRIAGLADDYFIKCADEIIKNNAENKERECYMPIHVIQQEEVIVRMYIFRQMIHSLGVGQRDISYEHYNQLCELEKKQVGAKTSLPNQMVGIRRYNGIAICIKLDEYSDNMNKREVIISKLDYDKNQEIPKKKYTKWFDYDKIMDTPCVRTRKTGDYILLENGGKKSVQRIMIDEKIPKEQRNQIQVVADGAHVMWVVGYRISAYYKITCNTKRILQVSVNGGNEDER